jgi:hypothetical protein
MFRVAADALVELITENDIQLQSCVKIGFYLVPRNGQHQGV